MAIVGYYSSFAGVRSFGVERLELPAQALDTLGLKGPGRASGAAERIAFGVINKPRFESRFDESFLKWCSEASFDYVIADELTLGPSAAETLNESVVAAATIAALNMPMRVIANLTMRPSSALEAATQLAAVPGVGAMVNLITMGCDIVHEIREVAPNITIFGNIIGRGMVAAGNDYYVSEEVLCRLARISGANVVYIGSFLDGVVQTRQDRSFRLRAALASQIVEGALIEESSAAMSGGNDLLGLWRNLQLYDGPVTCLLGREAQKWYTCGMDPRAVAAAFNVLRRGAVQNTAIEFMRDVRDSIASIGKLDHSECLEVLGFLKPHNMADRRLGQEYWERCE